MSLCVSVCVSTLGLGNLGVTPIKGREVDVYLMLHHHSVQ